MPKKRRPLYSSTNYQTEIDFAAPKKAEPVVMETATEADPDAAPEAPPPPFSVKPGWVATSGRTRTWLLCNMQGTKLAEICTKRDAQFLADILNHIAKVSEEKERSR